ncbi:MAG: hypothetical protein SFV52_01130 [Saprospiraceae bacterium]|nr:hypothetical protein [Saprospiraceae bacterium]
MKTQKAVALINFFADLKGNTMTVTPVPAFEEFAQFLANLSPNKILLFKTSEASRDRVNFLLAKNADQGLSADEQREMEQYMFLEHIVQLAKAKVLLKKVQK